MADEQSNSQSSYLDEEDLNKLEEAVSKNNACSSSTQSGEVNVCLSSSVQAIMPHCQFTNCTINIKTAKELFPAGSTEVCFIFL